jgi:hypothetical protein
MARRLVLLAAPLRVTADELPIVDAHIHCSHDAWDTVLEKIDVLNAHEPGSRATRRLPADPGCVSREPARVECEGTPVGQVVDRV